MQTSRWLYLPWILLWLVLFGGQLTLAVVTLSHTSDLTSWLIVLGLCLPVVLLLIRTIRERRRAQQVLAGEYWVHWTYTESEWQALRESSQHWRWYRGALIMLGVSLFFVPILGTLLWIETVGINRLDGLAALGVLLVMDIHFAFIDHIRWRYPSRQAKREVFIGARTVYYGLQDVIWVKHLHQISLEQEKGQRLLALRCFRQGARGGRAAGTGSYSRNILIPIPQGYEQEAHDLMHRFHQRPVKMKLEADQGTGGRN